jgi:hypothetical protein
LWPAGICDRPAAAPIQIPVNRARTHAFRDVLATPVHAADDVASCIIATGMTLYACATPNATSYTWTMVQYNGGSPDAIGWSTRVTVGGGAAGTAATPSAAPAQRHSSIRAPAAWKQPATTSMLLLASWAGMLAACLVMPACYLRRVAPRRGCRASGRETRGQLTLAATRLRRRLTHVIIRRLRPAACAQGGAACYWGAPPVVRGATVRRPT